MLLIDEFVKYADRGLDGNGKQKLTIFLDFGKYFFHIRYGIGNDLCLAQTKRQENELYILIPHLISLKGQCRYFDQGAQR